jgi:hypothetical protein
MWQLVKMDHQVYRLISSENQFQIQVKLLYQSHYFSSFKGSFINDVTFLSIKKRENEEGIRVQIT